MTQALVDTQRRLPPDVRADVDGDTLQWYLADRYYEPVAAASKLTTMRRWRKSFALETRNVDTTREAQALKGYLHSSRDVLGRPVVVAVARRHSVLKRRLLESKLLCVEILEQALQMLGQDSGSGSGSDPGGTLPGTSGSSATPTYISDSGPGPVTGSSGSSKESSEGDASQILGIFDLRQLSPESLDFEFVFFLIDAIYNYYPQRLGQVLLLEAPFMVFQPAWGMIQPALGKHGGIVRFVDRKQLRTYFTPETLPKEFR